MKIVVTAQGETLESPVDPRFGRARFFILTDPDTKGFSVVDNTQNLGAPQGAGIQAAKRVADLGADVIITGQVGPKAFAALQAGGVKVYMGATGTVTDAIEQFKLGKLKPSAHADGEGRWQ